MKKRISRCILGIVALGCLAPIALAQQVVIDYEDLTEGPLGIPFTHHDITYHDLNNVSGVFPDGSMFGPQPNDQCICEDATDFFTTFPGWGSPVNVLTFGTAYVPGPGVSLGRLSTVTLDLPGTADSASVQIGYYENGPWGGIEYHMDGLSGGQVVASDSFTIADGGGRDNGAVNSLSISGATFDQIHLYARYGNDYSMPRAILDDLTLNYVVGGPALTITGDCPGSLTFAVTGATPGARVGFLYANGAGSIVIPGGKPCAGTQLGLNSSARLGATVVADGNGEASIVRNIPDQACGGQFMVQAIDASSCTTTNVAALP